MEVKSVALSRGFCGKLLKNLQPTCQQPSETPTVPWFSPTTASFYVRSSHAMAPRASVASVLGAVLWAALSLSAHARTLPSEVDKLLALKVELEARGLSYLLDTWTCPDVGPCDPCGPDAGANNNWGQWHYVACRVVPDREYRAAVRAAGVAERRGSRRRYGLVTNVHLSDLAIEGTLDSMRDVLCPFTHLRELDIDGGRLTGPVPRWIGECFPRLLELDLSHNELSGSVPTDVWPLVANIEQIKLEDNRLTGEIPAILATLPNLRVLWLDENDLSGVVPAEFGAANAFPRILSLNIEDNPKLCGAAPNALAVDWTWHLDNQAGQSRDWFGFCQKDACGVFVYGGTRVGGSCPQTWELESASESLNCGKRWDQCGGTVSVQLTNGGDDGMSGTVIDVPFDGARCCRRGLACVEAPDPDASPGTAYYQCTPDPTAAAEEKPQVTDDDPDRGARHVPDDERRGDGVRRRRGVSAAAPQPTSGRRAARAPRRAFDRTSITHSATRRTARARCSSAAGTTTTARSAARKGSNASSAPKGSTSASQNGSSLATKGPAGESLFFLFRTGD